MTLAVSSSTPSLLASGIPLSPVLKFWSLSHLAAEAEVESEAPISGRSGRSAKAKKTSRGADRDQEDFLSGLLDRASGEEDEDDEGGDEDDDDEEEDSSD